MIVEQIYTGCLASAAYYIESEGEAVIIDPMREIEPYLERAKKSGATIKYIFETHFHADFVSGHVDLAKQSGATIVYGPGAKAEFDMHEATDGEVLKLGKVSFEVLHTPGHTSESTTFLLKDENGKDHSIFTGDTLFIGDVGRPDLAVKSDLTKEDLAAMLFESLRHKIMPLADDVIVYPAHGAGSACGKNMSSETTDTLGNQKMVNYALRADMTKEEFIKEVTEGILPPPQYFPKNALMNKQGYTEIDKVLERGSVALDADTFEAIANHEGALVLDTRKAPDFTKEHIPNSIFIGIDGGFAPWVGALITDLQQAIVFIADEGREEEVVTRLSRVGYDNTMGYLKGGLAAWKAAGKETDSFRSITPEQFEQDHTKGGITVLDVRKTGEYAAGHVEDATNFPLDSINSKMNEVDADKEYYVHCAGGYRSVIASSILRARGVRNVIDVQGGYKAISETDVPTTIEVGTTA